MLVPKRRLPRMRERIESVERRHAIGDPFAGLFDSAQRTESLCSGLLRCDSAREWLDVIDWCAGSGLYTYQRALESISGPRVRSAGSQALMMSSYDYLGLLGHPRIEDAAVNALRQFGTGCGGVRLLTGTTAVHLGLEDEIARFKGVEAAITFTSGYVANLAAISALLGPEDGVVLDRYAHRSLVDACRLARVPVRTYRHNDLASLERVLKSWSVKGRRLVVAEGVYSMDGDICPLPEIVDLKERFDAHLLVDEAHSLGVLGENGRGVNEHFRMDPSCVDLWMGSLSKAVPSSGGYLAGSRAMITYLQHGAAPFMFSAAATPANAAAALESLRVMRDEGWRRKKVMANAALLREGLVEQGWDVGETMTPIIPVVLGIEEQAWGVARALEDLGIFVSAVVPPAVATGSARLRLCAMASHSDDDIAEFLDAIRHVRDGSPFWISDVAPE